MTETIYIQDLIVPDELERQKIFYLQKKVSSITAWRRIYGLYKDWADVTKKSLHEAEKQGWVHKTSIHPSDLEFILKGLAKLKEAISLLEKDNFKKFTAPPFIELCAARKSLTNEMVTVARVDEGENGIDEEHTPLWQEYCEAMRAVFDAWEECSMHIYERDYFAGGLWFYSRWLNDDLGLMHFPAELEAVPDPVVNEFVRVDELVSCAGIWEPVAAPVSSFIDRFTGGWKPLPPFEVVGPMKYFVARARAPGIILARSSDSDDKGVPLVLAWRLLWRDERYLDGTIPQAEAHYQFMEPEHSRPKSSGPLPDDGIIWAWSGAAAPVSGRWLREADGKYVETRKKGQRMSYSWRVPERWILIPPQ